MGICSLSSHYKETPMETQTTKNNEEKSSDQLLSKSDAQLKVEDKLEQSQYYQPSVISNSNKLIKITLQVGNNAINLKDPVLISIRISELKNEILNQKKEEIIKYTRLDQWNNFELYNNDKYLKNNDILLLYCEEDITLTLVSFVSVRVKIEQKPQELWIRKMFLSQNWEVLKEKMAFDLKLDPSQLKINNYLIDQSQSLLQNGFIDGGEITIAIK